jgi:hypothetical protein
MAGKTTVRRVILASFGGAIGLGLVTCHPSGVASSGAPSAQSAAQAPVSAAPAAQAPSGLAFQVVLTLSPAAAAQIASTGQSITVPAEFYGDPIDPTVRGQDQGRLDLAPEEDVTLTGAGTANFAAPAVDQSKLALVEGGTVEVAIDVSSGNHVSENNLLDCDTFMDQSVQTAAAKPIQIHCKLIGES